MIPSSLILEVDTELERAKRKHPYWPSDDMIHAAAIVAEESGELVRAALNAVYESGSVQDVRKEAIQTIATCIRLLTNLKP